DECYPETTVMRCTILLLIALMLALATTIVEMGKCKNPRRPTSFCTKRSGCPYTYKCDKRNQRCCQLNLGAIPDCITFFNETDGIPRKCRGGGSKRCPPNYTCKTDPKNSFSLCCKCEILCIDHKGNSHCSPWRATDGCNNCKCEADGTSQCTNTITCQRECKKKLKNTCEMCECTFTNGCIVKRPCETGTKGKFSDYTPCPKDCGKKARVRQCSSTGRDGQPCKDMHVEIKDCQETCHVQPGVRLSEIEGIVLGGQEVKIPFNYRWMVSMDIPFGCGCGGSIISSTHILTAAHCLPRSWQRDKYVTIKTGKHDLTKTEPYEQTRTSMKFIIHPGYNAISFDNDIAILVVAPPLEFNKHTQPVLLPENFDIKKGLCRVMGWGDTNIDDGTCKSMSDVLLNFQSKLDDPCLKVTITENMLCASGHSKKFNGSDSCYGDSGGPLACRHRITRKWVQHGIVSWGLECGTGSGVYTKVVNYIDWIMGELGYWGGFSDFTPCCKSCGGGTQSRVSMCHRPPSIPHGKCKDPQVDNQRLKTLDGETVLVEEVECNTQKCPYG
ncbi:unnamed protein product, partial [Owenia fusiformis]